jgi:CRP-like cAMP-binding protein
MLTAERVDFVGLLEDLPPFRGCAPEALEAVAGDALRAHCAAGEMLCGLPQDKNLYVLIAGSAVLRVSPGLSIKLEPGDYFGQLANPFYRVAGTVTAVTDVEVLVIGPADLARLELPASA